MDNCAIRMWTSWHLFIASVNQNLSQALPARCQVGISIDNDAQTLQATTFKLNVKRA